MNEGINLVDLSHVHPIVFYDGVCYLCDRSVKFILKKDAGARFRFCTLQDAIAHNVFPNSVDIKERNSVILLHKGIFYDRSDAAIRILISLGGWLSWFGYLALGIPTFLRNGIYKVIASYRYVWFGKSDTCLMPHPRFKSQFLLIDTINPV